MTINYVISLFCVNLKEWDMLNIIFYFFYYFLSEDFNKDTILLPVNL